MIVGDWTIDDAGMMTHLKCDHPATWGIAHRCWHYTDPEMHTGTYTEVRTPDFIILLSKIQYDIWVASREPRYGQS